MFRHSLLFLLFALAGILLPGCGSGQRETTPVSGKITVDGKPLTTGRIMFWPDDGGPTATSTIGSDGSYRLTTYRENDGAVLGPHKVTVEAVNITNPEAGPKSFSDELKNQSFYRNPPVKTKELVPRQYALRQTSGLTAEVTRDVGTIDFDLKTN